MRLKSFLIAAACALLAYVSPADAQLVGMRDLGYVQMTSLSAATPLPSIPSGALEAFIVCTGQTVMWRSDNVAPTATVGMPLTVNTPFPYIGSLVWLQIIQTSASAACDVEYFGY